MQVLVAVAIQSGGQLVARSPFNFKKSVPKKKSVWGWVCFWQEDPSGEAHAMNHTV